MNKEDAEEYTQSLGQIVGGSWRQIELAKKLGVPKALGLEVPEWVEQRLGGYVRLAVDERRKAAKELSERGESTRGIAETLGVHHATAARDVAVANATADDAAASSYAAAEEAAVSNETPPLDAVAALAASDQVRAAAENAEKRQARRSERIARVETMANPSPSLPRQRYPVIYADPPWRYDFAASDSRAIENQYPTMELEQLCALDVPSICTEAAILFLWATSPKLPEALSLVTAWGFEYRTCAVWTKPQIGMGYYFRQQHELLLVATKGDMPTPLPADRPGSVFTADRTEHSEKPEEIAKAIKRMYPSLPRIELFSRAGGWAVWGNESAA